MAEKYVKFSQGLSSSFEQLDPDPDTLYYLLDKCEIYLGDKRFGIGDISIEVTGDGNVISDVAWRQSDKTMIFTLGEAADPEAIRNEVYALLNGGLIVENPLIRYEAEGKHIETCLNVTTQDIEGEKYVVLKGFEGAEISKIRASDIVASGMIKAVSTIVKGEKTYLVLTFNMSDGSETRIELDVSDLVDVYTVSEDGGLELIGNKFGIQHYMDTGVNEWLNRDTELAFGETFEFNTFKYDKHGLVSGVSKFRLAVPELPEYIKPSGEAGDKTGYNKLLTYVGFNDEGVLTGNTVDIIDDFSSYDSTQCQIPTAQAVNKAIKDSESIWG